ncbi:efflux RND transporter periplasmic adaptor subunit [Aliidiomarina celeris]|uniref:efflux RND transporter periplasmic adaptor subunit n=1 Tax=Aliidiomarina celeris TaxID=2249428 RepID=UPI000DE981E9|nr:efflux RND transporter periplasmic adaptor subunit [Aliidiomarina celeris]
MLVKRMVIMLLSISVVLGLIFGYKAVGNYFMNDFFNNMPAPTVTITATEVDEQQWTSELSTVGSFAAVNGTELSVQTAGVITAIHVENGQAVEAGDLLFELDTDVDRAQLQQLIATAALARTEARRLERLVAGESVSASDLERAQGELAQAEAAVETQRAQIRLKTVRAPFSGVLGIRMVNLGDYVSPGTALIALEQFKPIYFNFTLAERFLTVIEPGMTVNVHVESQQGLRVQGEVIAVEPRVNGATRTFQVQAKLANDDNRLRPGMFARVSMEIGAPRTAKVIPRTAVQFNPFGNVVYVITENEEEGEQEAQLQVQQRLIRTGEERGDVVEVVEGLQRGERIATSGLLKLRNGAVVKINNDPDVQPSAELNPTPANR